MRGHGASLAVIVGRVTGASLPLRGGEGGSLKRRGRHIRSKSRRSPVQSRAIRWHAEGTLALGYKDAAPQMKSGFTVYCFKFVEPGAKIGTAFDRLIFVNDHWAIFPKRWVALQ